MQRLNCYSCNQDFLRWRQIQVPLQQHNDVPLGLEVEALPKTFHLGRILSFDHHHSWNGFRSHRLCMCGRVGQNFCSIAINWVQLLHSCIFQCFHLGLNSWANSEMPQFTIGTSIIPLSQKARGPSVCGHVHVFESATDIQLLRG